MELNPLLRHAVELGASDIHLKVGLPPILRRDGTLSPLEEWAILSDKDMDSLIEVVGKRSPERLEAFKQTGDLDIAFQEGDLPRFRVNAFRQRGHIDRKSTRLNSSHSHISYAVFCLKKKKNKGVTTTLIEKGVDVIMTATVSLQV